MAWYDFLFKPISFGRANEPVVSVPREKPFLFDLRERVETGEPFSVVHILVREGDAKFICDAVRDISLRAVETGRGVGVFVPAGGEYAVYDRLSSSLSDCSRPYLLRIGSAVFDPVKHKKPGDVLVDMQNDYSMLKVVPVEVPEVEPVLV